MTRRYLLSIVANNRIGVLPAITGAIHELGGDMQEASQTAMHGVLSMVLVADFPEHYDSQVIVDHISGVARPFEAAVTVRTPSLNGDLEAHPAPTTERFFLVLNGDDTPGLIRQVTARLAAESIDIADLYAVREAVGGPVLMVFELAVPEQADLAPLRGELESLGNPDGLAVELQHESFFNAGNVLRPVRLAKAARTAPLTPQPQSPTV